MLRRRGGSVTLTCGSARTPRRVSEVGGDAVLLPIAVAHRVGALRTADLGLGRLGSAAFAPGGAPPLP